MSRAEDYPIEVTLVDGSRWIVCYRLTDGTYAKAVQFLQGDAGLDRWMPADDLDGVQRRLTMIRLGQVVAVREVEGGLCGAEHPRLPSYCTRPAGHGDARHQNGIGSWTPEDDRG